MVVNFQQKNKKNKDRIRDVLTAILVLTVAFFGIYYFLGRDLLIYGLGNVEAFEAKISIKVRDSKKGWVERKVNYWRDEKGRFMLESQAAGKVEKILFDGEICWRETAGRPSFFELDLQPNPFEFDYAFGRFFMDNEENIPDLKVFPDQTVQGRLCRHYLFKSKWEPDATYEIWVDRQFGLPIMLEKTVRDSEVLRLETESIGFSNQMPKEIEVTSVAVIREKIKDPYSNFRIPFLSLSSLSGIRPAVPSKVPGDLRSPTFYLFPVEKFSSSLIGSPVRNILVIVYRDKDRYLQIFEYRGQPKKINVKEARIEKLKDQEVYIFALPGFWWAQMQMGDMVVNVKTNITYQEMIDMLDSLRR